MLDRIPLISETNDEPHSIQWKKLVSTLGQNWLSILLCCSLVVVLRWVISSKLEPPELVTNGLWAVLTVNHPVVREGETKDLLIELTLVNDSMKTLDPKIADSRIIINGKDLTDSSFPVSNGLRENRFTAMSPGDYLRFKYALGKYCEKPGIYRVSWRGMHFVSHGVVFRVLHDPKRSSPHRLPARTESLEAPPGVNKHRAVNWGRGEIRCHGNPVSAEIRSGNPAEIGCQFVILARRNPVSVREGDRKSGPGRPGWLPTQVSGKEVTSPPPPPGSRGALLLPSPLRTTRKPFGLCRSSLSQGSLRNPVGHKCTTCTILVWS